MSDFLLILKKELLDIFRDKRSFITLFIPVIIFPLMYTLMGTQLKNDSADEAIPCIVEYETDEDRALYDALFETTGLIEQKDVQKTPEEDLKSGSVRCIIRVSDNTVTLISNKSSTKSLNSAQIIQSFVSQCYMSGMEETLQYAYDVSIEQISPFNLEVKDLSEITNESGNSIMASIAPMLLVMIIMSGGVSVAVDLFTGEKEKGTFESLLTTQVSRMSILMSKFTATLIVSLASMILSVLAYVISFKCSDSALMMLTGGAEADAGSVSFSIVQIFELIAVCFTLSVFAVSLMTLLGLHARTVKEAQSQMSLITIFPTLLSGLTMFMESANIKVGEMWIPVFNAIVSIKMIFLGTVEPVHILFTALSSLLYSFVMWFLSVRMLNSEKLLRG